MQVSEPNFARKNPGSAMRHIDMPFVRMVWLLNDCVGIFLLVCLTKVVSVVSECEGRA